uniref:V-SNARE coiled-coil homology domain-containing protein n=1 Tax=Phaeomonas parva TaxID=124430 RepID=A0A7S1TW33_9STRA|mmetsp:Transcript_20428/g.62170  ORF Transcript_20428/g.62170 Transcript_20428/m.62170 type:complete len:266 (+) Transcript_20428:1689-2486(+)
MARFLRMNSGGSRMSLSADTETDVYFIGVTHQTAEPVKQFGMIKSKYAEAENLGEAGQGTDRDVRAIYDRLLARKPAPGWDEIAMGALRAVKCPIHTENGVTNFCCVFDSNADSKKVQSFVEHQVLMLGPIVAQYVEPPKVQGDAFMTERPPKPSQRQMQDVIVPRLEQEIQRINTNNKLSELAGKVDDVKSIMIQNVDMILERQERLEALENQSEGLMEASQMFRTNARKLKRWHLMNQVKWGIALGTAVTASVAIPIAILVAV